MAEEVKIEEKDYAWKDEQERILKKWADKGMCYKMMHERAYKRYWCLNAWFNIPVIIISTITGTGNFASGSFENYPYVIFILGGFNIFAGILATIATYTGVSQKLEAHRFCSVSWDKFARKVQIELAKPRADRVKARDFIKQSAEEYDRLIEMSPILPNDIIRWFTNILETGDIEGDDGLNEIEICMFECCCFPCGCNYCVCFRFCCCCCCCGSGAKATPELIENWKHIELPDIIGRIKPTEVAVEPEPVILPEIKVETVKEENVYNIYSMD